MTCRMLDLTDAVLYNGATITDGVLNLEQGGSMVTYFDADVRARNRPISAFRISFRRTVTGDNPEANFTQGPYLEIRLYRDDKELKFTDEGEPVGIGDEGEVGDYIYTRIPAFDDHRLQQGNELVLGAVSDFFGPLSPFDSNEVIMIDYMTVWNYVNKTDIFRISVREDNQIKDGLAEDMMGADWFTRGRMSISSVSTAGPIQESVSDIRICLQQTRLKSTKLALMNKHNDGICGYPRAHPSDEHSAYLKGINHGYSSN